MNLIAYNKIVDAQVLKRSKRAIKERNFGNDFITYIVDDNPTYYDEAIKSIDTLFWLEAINNGLDSIMSNHTWELVEVPLKTKSVGCK